MTASGGSVGVRLPAGIPAAVVTSAVRGGFAATTPGARTLFMPMFDTTLLTDAELALISAYIGAK
jgi:hypothetical protein